MAKNIGEILLRENVITTEQLQLARKQQQKDGTNLGASLVKLGFIKEGELASFLSKQYGVPAVNLRSFKISPDVIKLVPKEVVVKYNVIPVSRVGNTLTIAMSEPTNINAIDEIKFITNLKIETVVAPDSAIADAIDKYYGSDTDSVVEEESLSELDEELEDIDVDIPDTGETDNVLDLEHLAKQAPIVKYVNMLLIKAIKEGVSDIHIEPYEKVFRIRFRLDGVLHEVFRPPMKLKNAITSRIKIMSNLDIAEKRLPQDGRIKLKFKTKDGKVKDVDFRVSVLPTLFGEKTVLRILDKSNLRLDMTKLGFDEEELEKYKRAVHSPYGMILTTGPTGSGKTTTLYSSISDLNKPDVNIITVEDPVEFNLDGIRQVQVNPEIGLTFAEVLRSVIRQDPDILMVGEIRDFETAEIAVKAALTGHLVLSTLHTNDAPSTVNRLINMGIEPFLVSEACRLIMAQRLVRKICSNCKVEDKDIDRATLIKIGIPEDEVDSIVVYKGKGCERCGNVGYKGRIGLYEVMPITSALKELIIGGASEIEIRRQAIKEGMKTLRMTALNKLKQGLTTVEEVLRVTAE